MIHLRRLTSHLLLCLLWTSAVPGQPVLALGGWKSGPALCCALFEGTALVGSASGVDVYDLGEPAAPRRIARLELDFAPRLLCWEGGPAGVALGDDGVLRVLDMQDPAQPAGAGGLELEMSGVPLAAALAGEVLYVAGGAGNWVSRIQVVDLAESAAPVALGSWDGWETVDLAVDGDLLLQADNQRIRIWDIQDRRVPLPVGQYLDYMFTPRNLVAEDGIAYLAYTLWDQSDGFCALDLSDPADPQWLGELDLGQGRVLAVRQGMVYGQTDAQSLLAMDFTDPRHPQLAGSSPLAGNPRGAARDGELLLSLNSFHGSLLSLAEPTQPQQLAHLDYPGPAVAVAARDGIAWLAQQDRVSVLDIHDPGAVDTLGSFPVGSSWSDYTQSLRRLDEVLLVGRMRGALLLAIGQDGRLTPLTELPPSWDGALKDGILFSAEAGSGLSLYDVAEWSAPQALGSMPLGNVRQLERSGDLLAVRSSQPHQVSLLDIRVARQPRLLSQLSLADWPYALALLEDRLYLSWGFEEPVLDCYDLSSPEEPVLLGRLSLPGFADALAARPGRLLAGSPSAGWLNCYDLAGDGTPLLEQELTGWGPATRGEGGSPALLDNCILVPAGDAGLHILQDLEAADPLFRPQAELRHLSSHQLSLSWTRHPAAGHFRVEVADSPAGPWTELLRTDGSSCLLPALEPRRFFRVCQDFAP